MASGGSDEGAGRGGRGRTVLELLTLATGHLERHGIEAPRLTAEVLLSHVVGVGRLELYLAFDKPLGTAEVDRFRESVRQRQRGVPTQYIVGSREFWSLSFVVRPGVLVPRPETEHLVAVATAALAGLEAPRVLDVGTGSGCIAVAIAREVASARLVATDLSDAALAVARENVERHGVGERVTLRCGDGFGAVAGGDGPFDVIVSNPPYIPSAEVEGLPREVRDHEPRLALDGGADGLGLMRRLVSEAPAWLRPGGLLALEVAAGQAVAVRDLLVKSGSYADAETTRDHAGIDRVVAAWTRPG